MYHVTTTLIAQEGHERYLEEFCKTTVGPAAAEEGCVAYDLLRCREEPRRFVFRQTWRDERAYREHFAKPYVVQFLREIRNLLERPPEVLTYDLLDGAEATRAART